MLYYNHPHHRVHLKIPHTIDVKRTASYYDNINKNIFANTNCIIFVFA